MPNNQLPIGLPFSAQLVAHLTLLSAADVRRLEAMLRVMLDLDQLPSLEGTSVLRASPSLAPQVASALVAGHLEVLPGHARALPSKH